MSALRGSCEYMTDCSSVPFSRVSRTKVNSNKTLLLKYDSNLIRIQRGERFLQGKTVRNAHKIIYPPRKNISIIFSS